MKLLYITLFCFFLTFSNAQYSPTLKGTASCSRFTKSTTCFVLTGDSIFDAEMKAAFESFWKITPYRFISEASFKDSLRQTDLSFVWLNDYKVQQEKKIVKALGLVNGGFGDLDFYLNSTLAYVSCDNLGLEKNTENLRYRAQAMLFELHQIISTIAKKNLSANDILQQNIQLSKLHCEKAALLKDKTLLIDKEYLLTKIVSLEELTNKYPYTIELVSRERIAQALKNKEAGYAVLISAENLYKITTVIDCENFNFIYSDLEMQDVYSSKTLSKLSVEDILKITTAIKKSKLE